LAYRWHGKQHTLALGVYPTVGLMEARAARGDAKRGLAASIDPSIVKRDRKRAAKVATIASRGRLAGPSRKSKRNDYDRPLANQVAVDRNIENVHAVVHDL
jgi:hypothetical protein